MENGVSSLIPYFSKSGFSKIYIYRKSMKKLKKKKVRLPIWKAAKNVLFIKAVLLRPDPPPPSSLEAV